MDLKILSDINKYLHHLLKKSKIFLSFSNFRRFKEAALVICNGYTLEMNIGSKPFLKKNSGEIKILF